MRLQQHITAGHKERYLKAMEKKVQPGYPGKLSRRNIVFFMKLISQEIF